MFAIYSGHHGPELIYSVMLFTVPFLLIYMYYHPRVALGSILTGVVLGAITESTVAALLAAMLYACIAFIRNSEL